ncbi:hypothetical protein MJD09_23270 [bacterium]|nr:hypothetical protein [bacterium]
MAGLSTETRRSWVRIVVTYLFAFAYVAAAGYLIFEFIKNGNSDAALATFSGLGTFASAVVGFWFGGRKPGISLSLSEKEIPDA